MLHLSLGVITTGGHYFELKLPSGLLKLREQHGYRFQAPGRVDSRWRLRPTWERTSTEDSWQHCGMNVRGAFCGHHEFELALAPDCCRKFATREDEVGDLLLR
jgi:hypothetical protein